MTRKKFMKNRKFLNAFLIKDIEVQWREVHQSLKEIMVNEVAPGKEIQRSFVVFFTKFMGKSLQSLCENVINELLSNGLPL